MTEMFQRTYTHWRGRLSSSYKEYVLAGKDPTDRSPFDWISLDKWCAFCDHFESDNFKKRSKTNTDNRSHMSFSHTSGSKSYHSRLLEMEVQSPVENFANTHMKNDVFVSEKAEAGYCQMDRLRTTTDSEGESLINEREIIKRTLGDRSGYAKGLGYGVIPLKAKRKQNDSQTNELKEKLIATEEELRNATICITSQKKLKQEVLIQTHNEEIVGLKVGQTDLKEMISMVLQKVNSRCR